MSSPSNREAIRKISYSEMDNVRRKELATLRRPHDYKDVAWSDFTARKVQDYDAPRTVTRQRYVDDDNRSSRTRSQVRHRDQRNDHSRRARSLSNEPRGLRGFERHADEFFERNFDASFGGIIAAAAGAGIGALGGSRLGHANPYDPDDKKHRIRTLGGAVVGAVVFNAAENRWRKYVDEKE